MKRILQIVFFVILIFSFGDKLIAQPGRDKVEALRVSFISKRLELTQAESEKFWPVYNEYNDKVRAVKRNLRMSYKKYSGPLSENEAEELYQLELQSQQAETQLFVQYSEKLKAIVGVKKMVRLRLAEEDFKREIIKTIRERGE